MFVLYMVWRFCSIRKTETDLLLEDIYLQDKPYEYKFEEEDLTHYKHVAIEWTEEKKTQMHIYMVLNQK